MIGDEVDDKTTDKTTGTPAPVRSQTWRNSPNASTKTCRMNSDPASSNHLATPTIVDFMRRLPACFPRREAWRPEIETPRSIPPVEHNVSDSLRLPIGDL